MENIDEILKNAQDLMNELDAMNKGKVFLINEYKTNKKYFKPEPGKVTIEDVIKTAFEYGWACRYQYDISK